MIRDLKDFKKRYNNKISINIIGKSHDNRNIYEVILGNINSKKHVLIHAGIHGREYLTSLLIMKQLEFYLENYKVKKYHGIKYNNLFKFIITYLKLC